MISARPLHGSISSIRGRMAGAVLALVSVWVAFPATQFAQAQTYRVLYTFKGQPDGQDPAPSLVRDSRGNLYGTTLKGGTHDCGTVFKITMRGQETVLYSFGCGMDGDSPDGGVVRDADGNLYGTTGSGGYPDCVFGQGCGTVFKLDKNGKHSVLYRFGAMPDGSSPSSETLLLDEAGSLYGTTSSGGDASCNPGYGCGTVFKLNGNGRETILHTFTGTEQRDGALPYAGLVSDTKGNLYGTTSVGGAPCGDQGNGGCGTVFMLDRTGRETVLHRFGGLSDTGDPVAALVRDGAGNLYGTAGGGNFYGKVFKLDKFARETDLLNFTYQSGSPGSGAALARDAKGNLYGTTVEGGAYYQGTVFKLDKRGQVVILHDFTGHEGGLPHATLLIDSAGNLYGTAGSGGSCKVTNNGCGVVFKIARR
jgi:uncharacterized repeat protein (TIGR03803 family)